MLGSGDSISLFVNSHAYHSSLHTFDTNLHTSAQAAVDVGYTKVQQNRAGKW